MSPAFARPRDASALPHRVTVPRGEELRESTLLSEWIECMADGWLMPPLDARRDSTTMEDVAGLMELAALLQLQSRQVQALVR